MTATGSPQHVVLVSNLFPNSQEPGKGLFIRQLVEILALEIRVTVVSPIPYVPRAALFRRLPQSMYARVAPVEEHMGFQAHYCRHLVLPRCGFLRAASLFWPLLKELKAIHRREPIHLINAHWLFPDGVAAQWVGRALRLPVVLSARGCDINYYPRLFGRRAQIVRALKKSQAVTAVSENLKETMVAMSISPSKITVIPNGIDLRHFDIRDRGRCRRKLGVEVTGRVVLSVGSLDGVKATHYLLRAFALTKLSLQGDVRLWIVGDGPLRPNLEALACELGIRDRTMFWSNQDHVLMPDLMGAANVMALTSVREGRPNVILESLACGVPVVASKVGGIPEIVTSGGNGYLFDVGDVDALADALKKTMTQQWNRGALRDSVKDLSWEACRDKYLTLFEEVAGMPGGGWFLNRGISPNLDLSSLPWI